MMNSTPYYAVIFTSTKVESDTGYGQITLQMEELAKKQTGFIGIEKGYKEWYTWFKVRICKVERKYEFFK